MCIQPLQACATLILLAHQNNFRITCERIHQSSRVGGDDELRTLTGKFDGICDMIDQVGVQTEFRLVDANQRRRRGITQYRRQAKISQRTVGNTLRTAFAFPPALPVISRLAKPCEAPRS